MQASRLNEYRPFGQSTVQLPLLGFGAAPIGNLYQSVDDAVAQGAVIRALELGVRYFDTAPHYGFGLSEARLGRALRHSSDVHGEAYTDAPGSGRTKAIISTKVGRLLVPTNSIEPIRYGFANAAAFEPVFDYSYDAVMRSFEASLENIGCHHVDVLFAHDLGEMTHGADHSARFREFMEGGYRAMLELRTSGLVGAIGLGANEWQVCEQALTHGDFDGFLLAGRYTLLDQSACHSFLPRCAQRDVSVILGGPFNSGILATGVKGSGPFYYNYEPAVPEIIARVQKLETLCDEFDIPLAAAALQFPAAHPHICSVLAGFANAEQVERAVTWMNSPIPDDFWRAARAQQLIHAEAPLPGMPPQVSEPEPLAPETSSTVEHEDSRS